ncbi:MAG TPA: VOC family protein [Acidimicrobiales bacterium]|nr:VOC family protein [Acidimicrobiales bacterium]
MGSQPEVRGAIPYVFCADAGAVADWCVEVLRFVERDRWSDDDGVVRNVELTVGDSEVWLDGPVPDWSDKTGGLGSWVGVLVDNVDAVHQRIAAAGVDLDPPRTRDHGVREITVTDPEGHAWGFVQRLQ